MTSDRTIDPAQVGSSTADQLEAEGHDLIARGHTRLAEAAKTRAKTTSAAGDWIRVDSLPGSKRAALAAARGGQLRAVKRGRLWITTRADAAAWLANAKSAQAANDDCDDDLRASLGLARRRAS
jgi:hypothetical protein